MAAFQVIMNGRFWVITEAFIRTVRAVVDPGGQSVSANDRLYLASTIPTLILWGDRDEIIPVDHAHAAAERISGSRLEIFENAGHFLHVEEPARFAAALADFIVETEAANHDAASFREILGGGAANVDCFPTTSSCSPRKTADRSIRTASATECFP